MPPLLRFLLGRILSTLATLFIVTAILYGFVMFTPPEERASLYISQSLNMDRMTPEQMEQMTERIIARNHLRDPYPLQYALWMGGLLRGEWGYSPTLRDHVLAALLRRTPVTAELTLYAMLVFIPLGVFSGAKAAAQRGKRGDSSFRLAAFVATSMPPFVMALVLLSIFYVSVNWFPPERLSILNDQFVKSDAFRQYTGLLTIDGVLNQRPDISLDTLRHLVLPVVTLSLLHWATLGRVTRAAMLEELQKDHITVGRARGIPEKRLLWRHALRNVLPPALASSALSAASLFTGVFVVEVIFNFRGISELAIVSSRGVPDAPSIMGFAIYSVVVVLLIMLMLDILQALVDPRLREGLVNA